MRIYILTALLKLEKLSGEVSICDQCCFSSSKRHSNNVFWIE